MSEREPADRIRAFVALDLPSEVLGVVVAWQRRAIAAGGPLRWIPPEALHVTLVFLGHLPASEIERAAVALRETHAIAGPVPMRLERIPVPVPRRRPRVVAFDVESPAAAEVHADLVARLAAAGLHEPDGRPYWPHLSVARVRGDPGRGGGARRLAEGLPALTEGTGHTFGSVRIALYRSQLGSDGASPSALQAFELPPGEGAADEVI